MSDPDLPTTTEPAVVPSTMSDPPSTLGRNTLIVIAILMFILNPGKERQAERIAAAYKEAHPILTTVLDADAMITSLAHRRSYLLWSTMGDGNGTKTYSIGVLGMVFVLDAAREY